MIGPPDRQRLRSQPAFRPMLAGTSETYSGKPFTDD